MPKRKRKSGPDPQGLSKNFSIQIFEEDRKRVVQLARRFKVSKSYVMRNMLSLAIRSGLEERLSP